MMNKLLKILAAVLTVLLVAAFALPFALRGSIGELVKREANARLDARLDFARFDLSLLRHFPRASLDLEGLTLVGTGRFEGDTLLAADRISVAVNLWSLFGDQGIEVIKVQVVRPSVYAHKAADGAANWNIMTSLPQDGGEQVSASLQTEPSAFRLAVRDVRISDGTIRYADDSARMRFSTTPLSLRLRGDFSAERTDVKLRLRAGDMRLITGDVTLLRNVEAGLDAVVEADLAAGRFTLSDNRLRLNEVECRLEGWADVSNPEAVAVDLKAGFDRVHFKDVLSLVPAFYARDFRSLKATGELSLAAWARGVLRGDRLPAFEVKLDVRDGGFRYASLPQRVTGIHLRAQAVGSGGPWDETVVEVPAFGFTLAGNTVEGALRATHLGSDLQFDAHVEGRMDLGAVPEVYPLDEDVMLSGLVTADVRASGRLSDIEKQRYEAMQVTGTCVVEQLHARLAALPEVLVHRAAASLTPEAMTLGELNVRVGKSDLSANGQVTGYLGYLLHDGPLAGKLYVRSDLLDGNELLSVAATPDAGTTPAERVDTTVRKAPVVPRNLNLSLSVELHKILWGKMVLTGLTGGVHVQDGTARLDRLAMEAFGGRVQASGSYATTVDPVRPALRMALAVHDASFERTFDELEMVQRLAPLFRKTGGKYTLTLDLSATLDAALSPDLSTLDAEGLLRSSDIRLQNVEAFARLADALRYDKLRTIQARDVSVRFRIAQGRVTTQPFRLQVGGATVELSGSTGLDQTIDYTARVALPSGAGGGMLPALRVGIGGTFSDPRLTLGAQEAVEEVVTGLVQAGVQQLTGHATVQEALEAQQEKLETAVAEQKQRLTEEMARQAERLRAEAAAAGEKLVAAAEEQREKLVAKANSSLAKKAARKAGDELVKEARRQADKLVAEAETQIARLTGEAQ